MLLEVIGIVVSGAARANAPAGAQGAGMPARISDPMLNTEQVGWVLYTDYLIPFEVASMLLLVAMIGAIVLAKRRICRYPKVLEITPLHYTALSAALFMIGVIGVLVRRNIIIIFMSIELILNAVNINLVALSNELQNLVGAGVRAVFVIAVAAAEAAVGLGIIMAFYRNKETVNIDEMMLVRMRW